MPATVDQNVESVERELRTAATAVHNAHWTLATSGVKAIRPSLCAAIDALQRALDDLRVIEECGVR